MATKIDKLIAKMTPRQGKVLRFVVSTTEQPVGLSRVVNHIDWSDLPHSVLEAKATFEALVKFKLVRRVGGKEGFTSTQLGQDLIEQARVQRLWMQAPPPSVTGISTFKADPKKSTKKSKTRRK